MTMRVSLSPPNDFAPTKDLQSFVDELESTPYRDDWNVKQALQQAHRELDRRRRNPHDPMNR